EELLLDVADYRHVHHGPGIVLIGHEADYSLDNSDGRLGIKYNRKAPVAGNNHARLTQAFASVLSAALRLQEDGRLNRNLSFDGRNIEIAINDPVLAPNNEETRGLTEAELRKFADGVLGGKYS